MKKTILVILIIHFAFKINAQKVDYVVQRYPIKLPPVGHHEMKITDSMRFFHYRAFGVDTEYIPRQSLTNYLSKKYMNLDLSDYTRTSNFTQVSIQRLPHFYIDFFYYKPTILERKIIKKEYTKEDNSKVNGIAYLFNLSSKATVLFRSLTLDTLFQFQIPEHKITYTVDHKTLAKFGFRPVSETPFSDIDVLLQAVNEANDLIYRNIEIDFANIFTYSEFNLSKIDVPLKAENLVNNLIFWEKDINLTNNRNYHNGVYIHPFLNEEINIRNEMVKIYIAKISSLEDTKFNNLKIQDADTLASKYYQSMNETCMNWYYKKELILEAIDLWKNALEFVKNEPQYPDNNKLYDALVFNIAIGYTHLNQFMKARNYLALIHERMEYSIFSDKHTVLRMVSYVDGNFIPAREKLFLLRKWIRLID